LVEDAQDGIERAVKVLEKQRLSVASVDRDVVSALDMHQAFLPWPNNIQSFDIDVPLREES
jgi:hypothetical protein